MAQRLSMAELLKLKRRMAGTPAAAPLTGSNHSIAGRDVPIDVIEGATLYEKIDKMAFQNAMCLPPDQTAFSRHTSSAVRPRRIAVCLVIVDTLYHEEIWKRWTENELNDPDCPYKAELYIHAKYPESITSAWVKQRVLPGSFRPEWNSVEVVRAMLAVLDVAAKDANTCDRFLLGTETCIPLYSLREAGDILFMHGDVSWLDAYNEPQHAFENGVFQSVDPKIIPRSLVWKALPGWVILTRRHVLDILSMPRQLGGSASATFQPLVAKDKSSALVKDVVDLPSAFDSVYAPEEIYFPTMLAICGHLTDRRISAVSDSVSTGGNKPQILKRRVTFAQWKSPSDPNPITFEVLTAELLQTMRSSGAVFGRKFKNIPLDRWHGLVYPSSIACREPAKVTTSAVSLEVPAFVSSGIGSGSAEDASVGSKRKRSYEDIDSQVLGKDEDMRNDNSNAAETARGAGSTSLTGAST